MSKVCDVLKVYYESWKTGNFNPEIFCEDLEYTGPLHQCTSRDEFLELAEDMCAIVTLKDIDFKARFFNEDTQQACAIFDLITSEPIEDTSRCAELFSFEDNKIKSINFIFDPRFWESFATQV